MNYSYFFFFFFFDVTQQTSKTTKLPNQKHFLLLSCKSIFSGKLILRQKGRQAGETFHDQAPAETNHSHSPQQQTSSHPSAAISFMAESQNPVCAIQRHSGRFLINTYKITHLIIDLSFI